MSTSEKQKKMAYTKKQYRTEMVIISDILNATMESGNDGIIISSISRKANLSHDSAVQKCQKLIGNGLIETKSEKKKQFFVVTKKGIEFFHQIQRFIEFASEVKLLRQGTEFYY